MNDNSGQKGQGFNTKNEMRGGEDHVEVTALIETKTVPIAPESVSFNPPIYVHVDSSKQYKRSLVKNNFNKKRNSSKPQ